MAALSGGYPDAGGRCGITSSAGAYLLEIRLLQPLAIRLRDTDVTLGPGTYVYAGSANGPGGIKARVARHLRTDKKPHWHIDQLTLATRDIRAFGFPGGSECNLVSRLLNAGWQAPVAGFGSSDCRTCPAHLLRVDE